MLGRWSNLFPHSRDEHTEEARFVVENLITTDSPHPLPIKGIPSTWSKDGHIASFGTDVGNVGAAATPDIDRISLAVWSPIDQKSVALGLGSEGQFSPDGKWIVHGSLRGIVVQPFPGPGPRVQISPPGGNQPRWSRDGKHIFLRNVGKGTDGCRFRSACNYRLSAAPAVSHRHRRSGSCRISIRCRTRWSIPHSAGLRTFRYSFAIVSQNILRQPIAAHP